MRISDWSSDVCSSDLNSVNPSVPANIDLVCGDPLLELQSNAVNTLANNQIPGSNPWIAVVDWISDFLAKIDGEYDVVFMDCNPSFSLYTQIALSSRSEEHTSELQSLMRISYAVFCLKKKT